MAVILCTCGALLLASTAWAATPTIDRSLWPESLDSQVAFDRASRAEILVFSSIINKAYLLDNPILLKELNVQKISNEYVSRGYEILMHILLANYKAASVSCHKDDIFCGTFNNRADSTAKCITVLSS